MTTDVVVDPFVEGFFRNLQEQFKPSWWTRYLFHYSDITNAVSILKTGALLSRHEAARQNLLQCDSASASVIDVTDPKHLDYARLYFRPQTPPLFRVEGFCPENNRRSMYGAHCPVPVYFLFHAVRVLSMPLAKFSAGNLAKASSRIFHSAAHLPSLDFQSIYHRSWFEPEDRDRIIGMRCSEVIVPVRIPLDGFLARVVCRSIAERDSLLSLLDSGSRTVYAPLTHVHEGCFFRRNFLVSTVSLRSDGLDIQYLNDHIGPFKFDYLFESSGRTLEKSYDKPQAGFRWTRPPGNYELRILIDGRIAYLGKYYAETDSPF